MDEQALPEHCKDSNRGPNDPVPEDCKKWGQSCIDTLPFDCKRDRCIQD